MVQASKYSVGDKVVHPQHGAATIKKKVKQVFDGKKQDYFILEVATEQLTVMVPLDKVEDLIRPVISKTRSREVLRSLKTEHEEAGSNRMLSKARLTLSSELAFSLQIDDEDAIKKLDRALPVIEPIEE